MRFWDSSGIIPLLVREDSTDGVLELFRSDPELIVWWATPVECISALARREREGSISSSATDTALARFLALRGSWNEVDPGPLLRENAERFLRVHPLRAADALQLAAAFLAAESRPGTLEIVSLDERLSAAARLEGFRVAQIEMMS